jgi:predicted transcriptional regulator
MATTVHLPAELLRSVDARAKSLGISRNRFIRAAIEDKIGVKREWPAEVVSMLQTPADASLARAVDDMLDIIESSRRSRKEPTKL